TGRWPGPRESSLLPHQVDEDVLERALGRREVAELDLGAIEIVEQGGDVGARRLRVIGEYQFAAVPRQHQGIAGERIWYAVDLAVPTVPQRQRLQDAGDMIGIARPAPQPAAERDGVPHALEGIGRELLRNEPDHRAGAAVVQDDVVATHRDGALGRIDDAADD